MATTKEFVTEFLEKLKIAELRLRPMMGEYVIYYRDKVVGDICDNRVLIKICASSEQMLQGCDLELPYLGAKPMIRLKDFENAEFMFELFEKMYTELPERKKKK